LLAFGAVRPQRRLERTVDGLAAARIRGKGGPRFKMTTTKIAQAWSM